MTDLERIKKDVVEMDSRANVCWYDTKVLTKAVRLILEELTADRKTEHNTAFVTGTLIGEPQPMPKSVTTWASTEQTEDLQDWKDRMWAEAVVTEPTISKMEQVDKDINVRSKDEPQADCSWK